MAKKKVAPRTTAKQIAAQSQTVATAIKSGGRSIDIDIRFITQFLNDLLNISSPTGSTTQAIHLVREALANLKLDTRFNTKGALIAAWQGKISNRARAMTAHVDTLGAMVKEITPNGRLRLSKIGGYAWASVEGEGCSIATEEGRIFRGTLLPRKSSVHVHGGEVEKMERTDQTMEVRLDARTQSAEDTRRLGLEVGDFVAFDLEIGECRGDE